MKVFYKFTPEDLIFITVFVISLIVCIVLTVIAVIDPNLLRGV